MHWFSRPGKDSFPTCVTAMAFQDENTLLVALGSSKCTAREWKLDLMERGSSGSIWSVDLVSGRSNCLAAGLAFPYGIVVTPNGRIVVAEAWRHRLLDLGANQPEVLLANLPGYPARIAGTRKAGSRSRCSRPGAR